MSPKRAKSVCNVIGCPNLAVKNGRCELHAKQARREARARNPETPRPDLARWQRVSRAFLLEHPVCVRCGAASEVTDHIRAHKGDPALMFDPANLQPLCRRCNTRKAIESEGTLGQPRKAE